MSGNIQSHFSVSQWREGTSGGQRSRMLPNILQLKGPSPWQRITCSQMSTVPRLRETNTGSKEREPRKSATCNKHVKLFHMENTHQASSIHSFNRHYLCVTSTSGPVLGTEDTAMSQTKKVSAQHGVSHQWQMCLTRQFQLLRTQGFRLMLCASRHCGHSWACHVGSQQQKQQERENNSPAACHRPGHRKAWCLNVMLKLDVRFLSPCDTS